jgi:ATP-dependent helicase/nuclease subunit B
MGPSRHVQIDDWIRSGGIVIAASERAARVAVMAYHHRRRAEGATAWPAPNIQSWESFVTSTWEKYARDERMLLNWTQEQTIWAEIIAREQRVAAALEAPRQRLAAMAMRAHELLCSFAPRYLNESARSNWDNDPGVFSVWLTAFYKRCDEVVLISHARVPLELIHLLQEDSIPRAPILGVGFDRLLPIHKELFDAWGAWQEPAADNQANEIHFYRAADEESEIAACASWCVSKIAADSGSSLLVLSQDIAKFRGEIERAFLRCARPGVPPDFEFSLGVPLGKVPLVRAAHLLLRWIDGPLSEAEMDWLFSTGLLGAGQDESAALQERMRLIRGRNLARPEWTLQAFARQFTGSDGRTHSWLQSLIKSHHDLTNKRESTIDLVARVPDLLNAAGLPGERALSSIQFQAWQRWEQALELYASLGFDGRRVSWREFLPSLGRILDETLFAPESSGAPIQITGPAESAGLDGDAVWFLGADEETWPAKGFRHPFLPLHVHREFGMPGVSALQDWELAETITTRLLESAPIVNFSYASAKADSETQPSRLVARIAGSPLPLPRHLIESRAQTPETVPFADAVCVPFPPGKIRGGSAVLTYQSQCAFKSFAKARLGAQSWEPAEFGLSASERGLLLHAVLHSVWGGPPNGLRSLDDLLALPDLHSFVGKHVQTVLDDKLPDGSADRMPPRYLELEATRLQRLVVEWLTYETMRFPFTVLETESARTIQIADLELDLRLDRIDRLNNGSMLVIDYKAGNVSSKAWDLPRPEDVQLPLYAGFALHQPLGGLVFAKVRPGDFEFDGHVANPQRSLFGNLKRTALLARKPLTTERLAEWKTSIAQLARDFVTGRADVDPRDYPHTCDRCHLQALCRIHENKLQEELEDEDSAPVYE